MPPTPQSPPPTTLSFVSNLLGRWINFLYSLIWPQYVLYNPERCSVRIIDWISGGHEFDRHRCKHLTHKFEERVPTSCVCDDQTRLYFFGSHHFKGTVSRDFLLLVFFLNKFPPSLWLYHQGCFEFFRKFTEILAAQGLPPVSMTPGGKWKII